MQRSKLHFLFRSFSTVRGANPNVHCIVHKPTWTCTYIVSDKRTRDCAIIDSALDYEQNSGKYHYTHANKILDYVKKNRLNPKYLLETHVHADHISASDYILSKPDMKAQNCIGSNITKVQTLFASILNMKISLDGSQFDVLLEDNDELEMGDCIIKSMYTPGHTPVCTSFVIGNSVFVGDTLFMPDIGTARCDFPGGSSEDLFDSCTRILSLPLTTNIYVGHDYPGASRDFQWKTSVKEQKERNKMMKDGISKQEFVALRQIRDSHLPVPTLLLPSLQVNIQAGKFPEPENNGVSYIKIPTGLLDVETDTASRLAKKKDGENMLQKIGKGI